MNSLAGRVARVAPTLIRDVPSRSQLVRPVWGRMLQLPARVESATRQFHVTAFTCEDEQKRNRPSKKGKKERLKAETDNVEKKKSFVTEEMKMATTDVAKSLGGDWSKTADDLLARLVSHQQPPAQQSENAQAPEEDANAGSLLSTMGLRKAKESKKLPARKGKGLPEEAMLLRDDFDLYGRSDVTVHKKPWRREPRIVSTDLFGGKRLGIFDADSVKASLSQPQAGPGGLWEEVEREKLERSLGGIPLNAFDEMARWTRQGKMFKFPIDNEQDMVEEKQVKFYEHIFLDQHLGEFPETGPIRKFMELVCLGLGSNPWLSVQEKRGHLEWYAEYFREKEEILVASLGVLGKMKEKQA